MVIGCKTRKQSLRYHWLCTEANVWAKEGELFREDVSYKWIRANKGYCGMQSDVRWRVICRECCIKAGILW